MITQAKSARTSMCVNAFINDTFAYYTLLLRSTFEIIATPMCLLGQVFLRDLVPVRIVDRSIEGGMSI